MNEQFHNLPMEKQQRILNASMEVFAMNDYRHASTDDIAAKAGISKGLLFYYFHNKKSLYLYTYEYCRQITLEQILDSRFDELTDYFEILEYAAKKKWKIISENPYFLYFAVRSFYSSREEISDELQKNTEDILDHIPQYFKKVNMEKYRDGTDIGRITRMLLWMTDGYMNDKRRQGLPILVEEIQKDFHEWITMFRKLVYKEEYQQ